MLNISNLWLLFDASAALFIALNIFLMIRKNHKFILYLAFFSIVFECLALLGEYQQVLNAVNQDDISYILDVIPHIGNVRTPVIFIIIAANILLIIISLFFKKKH